MNQQQAQRIRQNSANNSMGRTFEEYIKGACELYRQRGRADVEKTAEPFRVTKKHGNGVFTGRFTALAQPDFEGTLKGGRSIVFEAKYTTTDRLKYGILTDAQIAALARRDRLGALTGVCAGIRDRFFFIPWDAWQNMKKYFGRKYVTAKDLEPFQVKFTGAVMFLDYLYA